MRFTTIAILLLAGSSAHADRGGNGRGNNGGGNYGSGNYGSENYGRGKPTELPDKEVGKLHTEHVVADELT